MKEKTYPSSSETAFSWCFSSTSTSSRGVWCSNIGPVIAIMAAPIGAVIRMLKTAKVRIFLPNSNSSGSFPFSRALSKARAPIAA